MRILDPEKRRADEEVQKPPIKPLFIEHKQEVVTADNRIGQVFWHDTVTTMLGVDLRNQELTGPALLLRLRLDLCPADNVAENNPVSVQLDSASLVGLQIVNPDKLLPMMEQFA